MFIVHVTQTFTYFLQKARPIFFFSFFSFPFFSFLFYLFFYFLFFSSSRPLTFSQVKLNFSKSFHKLLYTKYLYVIFEYTDIMKILLCEHTKKIHSFIFQTFNSSQFDRINVVKIKCFIRN